MRIGILLLSGLVGCSPCTTTQGLEQCGTLGELLSVSEPLHDVAWPPALDAQGDAVLVADGVVNRVSAQGTWQTLAEEGGSVAPAMGAGGELYLASPLGLTAWGEETGARWSEPALGSLGQPPSLAGELVFAFSPGSGLHALHRDSGEELWSQASLSAVGHAPDGTLRGLAGPTSDARAYDRLVSLSAQTGAELWSLAEPGGFVDFSLGFDGLTYAVTHSGALLQVGLSGEVLWRYEPTCDTCVVGAAPTVSSDVIYVPVWVAAETADGCSGGLDIGLENPLDALVDPLHAVDAVSGELIWSFDGFHTNESEFDMEGMISDPLGGPLDSVTTLHHPGGRPAVAEDGTLFVGADGSVVALNDRGRLQGRAVWDAGAGESSSRCRGGGAMAWVRGGVVHAPVLGPDGTLWVYGDDRVWTFDTGRAPRANVWLAPFGDTRNSGRAAQ